MYNIGAGSKDISPMNWGKYNDKNSPIIGDFYFIHML